MPDEFTSSLSTPGSPRSSTARSAAQWSSTYSQSRTFCPSPYTGSGLPASDGRIARIQDSNSRSAKTTATEKFRPAPACCASAASLMACSLAQNGVLPIISMSPSSNSRTAPSGVRVIQADLSQRIQSSPSLRKSVPRLRTLNGSWSMVTPSQRFLDVTTFLTKIGPALRSPSPSTQSSQGGDALGAFAATRSRPQCSTPSASGRSPSRSRRHCRSCVPLVRTPRVRMPRRRSGRSAHRASVRPASDGRASA